MTPSGRATDIFKDLSTNGTASILAIVGLFWIKQMVETGAITGEAGMVVFVGTISAAVTYLFNSANGRQQQRSFERGLNTPGPNDNATNITADTATVTDSGPTSVTTTKPTTPVVTRET